MPWTKLEANAYGRTNVGLPKRSGRILSYREALREAQQQALKKDSRVFIMGEGVDHTGAVFGSTAGLVEEFGERRIFDLPLSENGFTGIAVGAAICGMRPILAHMRMDFLLLSMDQIVNHAAKWHYMFGGKQNVPLTIRCIIGRGWGSAAQHSQSLHGMLMKVPGLKIVIPATAYDAKGLLLSSIADENPVVFIEHRWLYDKEDYVPQKMYLLPLGKGVIRRKGKDLTIIAISLMVFEALQAARDLAGEGIEAEVIDLRTLNPIDEDILFKSVKKTGRLMIVDTATRTGGASSDIIACLGRKDISCLKSSIITIASPDVPVPASTVLEKEFYPGNKTIFAAAKGMVK